MFGWFDEDGGSKIFWFEETKAGNQKLVRPDGTARIIKKKHEHFAKLGKQALAAWHDFILHPVCLKVTRDLKEVVPVSIESIGCGQGALGQYKFEPVGAINDKESVEFLF